MGKSLREYAAQNPQPEQHEESINQTANLYEIRQQAKEKAEEYKQSITQQISYGGEPHFILYTAVRAIGLLTHDKTWTEATITALDAVYGDLAQETLLNDNAAIAEARLNTVRSDYNKKLKQRLNTLMKQYKDVEEALNSAIEAAGKLEEE